LVTRGSALNTSSPCNYAIKNPKGLEGEYQFAGTDADWRGESAVAGLAFGFGAAHLLTLGGFRMTDFKTQLEQWRKRYHKKYRGLQSDKAKAERLKKEADWKKRFDDPKRPQANSVVDADKAAYFRFLREMRDSEPD